MSSLYQHLYDIPWYFIRFMAGLSLATGKQQVPLQPILWCSTLLLSYLTVAATVQVLRCVPPEHEHAVFAESIADVQTAFKLPAPLLSKWIACSAGVIDLRSEQLSTEQWVKMAVAICQAPSIAVKSLHVKPPDLDSEFMVAMTALQSIVGHTTHLQFLDLHGLHCISAEHLPDWHKLFCDCPDSLGKLLLDADMIGLDDVHERTSFFTAVAQVHGLRELHMPQWLKLTRIECAPERWSFSDSDDTDTDDTDTYEPSSCRFDHPEALDPLRCIHGLRIIVRKSELKNAVLKHGFPSGLVFRGCK